MQHNFLREQLPADTKAVYNYRGTGDLVSPGCVDRVWPKPQTPG